MNLWLDLRYSLRRLAKNRTYGVVAILTLALGIGATTSVLTVVYGILLRPLSYPDPDRLVRLWEVSRSGDRMPFSDPDFEDFRSQSRSLQGLAEYGTGTESVPGGPQVTRTMTASVSRDFFSIMRVQPVLGRGFVPEDQHFGAAPVLLVSYSYWKQHLGGATEFSHFKLTIEGRAATVIGVLPPGFRFPDNCDLWIPREIFERDPSRDAYNWELVGRLKDGVPLSQARAELSATCQRLRQQYRGETTISDTAIVTLQEAIIGDVRAPLLTLLAGVAFLFLIACANVSNLMLAQAASREQELAIRSAMGANRWRLIRQFMTEAFVLVLFSAAFGALTACWGVGSLLAMAPKDVPRLEDVSIALPTLLAAVGVAICMTVGLGILTAVRANMANTRIILPSGGQRTIGPGSHRHLGQFIVSVQIAVTLILLVGTGLLGRSLSRTLSVDPGFRIDGVAIVELALPLLQGASETEKLNRVQFIDRLLSRLRLISGVVSVGGTGRLPMSPALSSGTYIGMDPGEKPPRSMEEFDKWARESGHSGNADYCPVSKGYFHALGIPLLRGRFFEEGDTMEAPHVALVSQSLARQQWPNQDPLGRAIEFGGIDGDLRLLTVVGVVGDVHADSLEESVRPTVYVDYRQRPQVTQRFTAVLVTNEDPKNVLAAAGDVVRSLDPSIAPDLKTVRHVVSESFASRRFSLTLLAATSCLALVLASAGVYGVTAYSAAQRTREIGIRTALGADAGHVLRLLLIQGIWSVGTGVLIGVGGSLALTRLIQSLLFEVSPNDPLTFASVATVLAGIALLAMYVPARKASHVDPMIALRHE